MNMQEMIKALENIVRIVKEEAYDDQAREYIRNWANFALNVAKESSKQSK